jgi:hypothetical protein
VRFRIVIRNRGVNDVTITSIIDDVYGDVTALPRSNCNVPQDLAPSGRYSCRFFAPVTGQPGDYRDVVDVEAEDDIGLTTSDSDDAIVTLTDVLPEISVIKTANPTALDLPGGDVTFSVTVSNEAPEAITINALADDVFGPLDGQGSCQVPFDLAPEGEPGDSYACSFIGAVTGPAGVFTNTVTASGSDDDGNDASASDDATVVLADPGILTPVKTKLTMYYAPSDLIGVDRLTFNGYIRPETGEVFTLPFDQDVTVIAEIPDPDDPARVYTAFTGTVPAGSVSSNSSKYRYLARGSGINELVFDTVSASKTYVYLFIDEVDLLRSARASMTEAEYLALIEQIDRYTLRFLIGGRSWSAEIPLLLAVKTEHKLQLEKQP